MKSVIRVIKNIYRNIIYCLPKKMAHSWLYYKSSHRKLNWKNPTRYDEKIHWLMAKLYDEDYAMYADKLAVRDYVRKSGLEKTLIPLIGSYKSVDEIDYDALPNKFIMKTNHGSNPDFYELVLDKSKLDIDKLNKKMSKALKMNKATNNCQYQYAGIEPCIIVEELRERKDGKRLTDYKVVCSYGEPKYILVCSDRDEGRDYYTIDWEYIEFTKEQYRSKQREEKPEQLEELLRCASVLSKPFPLARVDFYIVNGKIYFGEVTLTPSAGYHGNLTEYGQETLGEAIRLI